MAYCPILIRLYSNEHPEYTDVKQYSIWMEIGYGMMSIYKSDWLRVGGRLILINMVDYFRYMTFIYFGLYTNI